MSRVEQINEKLATLLKLGVDFASVFKNPKSKELTDLSRESQVIRFIYMVKDDDIYMWNAAAGIHHEVALKLGLPITMSYETEIRIDGQANVAKDGKLWVFETSGRLTSEQEKILKKYRIYI